MAYFQFQWTDEIVAHLSEHDVIRDDFQSVVNHRVRRFPSWATAAAVGASAMSARQIPEELLAKLDRDRKLIEQELPDLADRDVRMRKAADEDTLSGHLRRAIHHSRRPLGDIGRDAGISTTILCDFLEGERTLRSDVLDRLTQAVGVTISLVAHAKE